MGHFIRNVCSFLTNLQQYLPSKNKIFDKKFQSEKFLKITEVASLRSFTREVTHLYFHDCQILLQIFVASKRKCIYLSCLAVLQKISTLPKFLFMNTHFNAYHPLPTHSLFIFLSINNNNYLTNISTELCL